MDVVKVLLDAEKQEPGSIRLDFSEENVQDALSEAISADYPLVVEWIARRMGGTPNAREKSPYAGWKSPDKCSAKKEEKQEEGEKETDPKKNNFTSTTRMRNRGILGECNVYAESQRSKFDRQTPEDLELG